VLGLSLPLPVIYAQTVQENAVSQAQRIFVHGMTRAYVDDHKAAIQFYENALRITPNEPAILSAMAESYAALNQLKTAIFYADQARSREPTNRYYHEQLAHLYLKSGDTTSAVRAYQTLLARFPKHVPSLHALGELQAAEGLYREALQSFLKLRDLDETPELDAKMLQLYIRLGDDTGLEQALTRLLTQTPNPAVYRRMLATLYRRTGRLREAATLYRTLLSENPADVETRLALAGILRDQGSPLRADSLLARTRGTPGESTGQLLELAAPLIEQAATDSSSARMAKRILSLAIEQEPENAEVALSLGLLFYRTGDYARAGKKLYQALQKIPGTPLDWSKAATAFIHAGEPRRAAEVAEEGLSLFPGQVPLLRTAAQSNGKAGHYDAAIANLEQALSILKDEAGSDFSTPPEFLNELGILFAKKHDYTTSDSLFASALASDPNNAMALNNLAASLAQRGHDLKKASQYARQAVELEPGNTDFMTTLGWVYFKMDNLTNALKWTQRALDQGGESAILFDHAGDIQKRLGHQALARNFWQRALIKNPADVRLEAKLQSPER